MKTERLLWLTVVIMGAIIIALVWQSPEAPSSIDTKEKEIKARDSLIGVIESQNVELKNLTDSLASSETEIRYRYEVIEITHSGRDTLPFALHDTAARYRYFAKRFPDLFTSQSN